jgi:Bacterial Ig domain
VANSENSNGATLQITISENDAPVCPGQVNLSVESGKQLVISQNPCTDADGDPLSFTIVDGPDHGTFSAMNPAGPFTYTSQAGYVGPERVTYRASDASTQSNVGAVSITVTAPSGGGGGGGGGGGTAPPPVVTPDVTPPALFLRPPSTALRRALRRGLVVTLRASEPARAEIRLRISKRDARRLGINRKAKKPVVVGRLTRTLSTGETKLVVKLTRKARRKLARVRSVKLTLIVTITDAAGNARRATRVLTLRRT